MLAGDLVSSIVNCSVAFWQGDLSESWISTRFPLTVRWRSLFPAPVYPPGSVCEPADIWVMPRGMSEFLSDAGSRVLRTMLTWGKQMRNAKMSWTSALSSRKRSGFGVYW